MRIIKTWLYVSIFTFIMAGCGGGQTNEQVTIHTGIVLDSHVIGMRYISTSTNGQIKKGITNSKGEYEYFQDGTTEFYIGNLKIGEVSSDKLISLSSISSDEIEQMNIARFLQTLDSDQNVENGIHISPSIDENAQNISLDFGETFDSDFEQVKQILYEGNSDKVSLVSGEQAMTHASKAMRLSSLKEFDLYKAVANEKNYTNSGYYNTAKFENSQRHRIYLWIWENILSKEIELNSDLSSKKIEDIEKNHDLETVQEPT